MKTKIFQEFFQTNIQQKFGKRIAETYHSAVTTIYVHFVSKNHKWKVLWIRRACLKYIVKVNARNNETRGLS